MTGDPQLLERIIWNLVDNAVRHNRPGGWIRLRTGASDGAVDDHSHESYNRGARGLAGPP
jgi:signal transduction histidine kinase